MLFQVPTASCTVEGNPALNRVRWAPSGREIAVGDSDGQVLVYEVGEVSLLCIYTLVLDSFSCVISSSRLPVLIVTKCLFIWPREGGGLGTYARVTWIGNETCLFPAVLSLADNCFNDG